MSSNTRQTATTLTPEEQDRRAYAAAAAKRDKQEAAKIAKRARAAAALEITRQQSAVKHLAKLAADRAAAAAQDARDTEYFAGALRRNRQFERLSPICRFELGEDEIASDPAIVAARRRYAAIMAEQEAAEVEIGL